MELEKVTILGALVPRIPVYVLHSWLAMVVLIVAALILRRRLSLVPSGFQNVMESVADFFLNFLGRSLIGSHWGRVFYPFIGAIGLYILVCNMMGLIPGFASATANINVTASVAVVVFLVYQYYGFKIHGISYINHFLGPIRKIYALPLMALIFFVEVISHIVRPITLSVRLFGNMVSKEILMFVLLMLVPAIIPVIILGLGTLIGIIQAFVFALLAALYIAGSVEEAH